MGPTKAIVIGHGLYDAVTRALIKDGFTNREDLADYVNHHYMVLPVVDNAGQPWLLDGKPVYCLHVSQYETVDDQRVHLARCPDCGGMLVYEAPPGSAGGFPAHRSKYTNRNDVLAP